MDAVGNVEEFLRHEVGGEEPREETGQHDGHHHQERYHFPWKAWSMFNPGVKCVLPSSS